MTLFRRNVYDGSRLFEDITDIVFVKRIYAQTG